MGKGGGGRISLGVMVGFVSRRKTMDLIAFFDCMTGNVAMGTHRTIFLP